MNKERINFEVSSGMTLNSILVYRSMTVICSCNVHFSWKDCGGHCSNIGALIPDLLMFWSNIKSSPSLYIKYCKSILYNILGNLLPKLLFQNVGIISKHSKVSTGSNSKQIVSEYLFLTGLSRIPHDLYHRDWFLLERCITLCCYCCYRLMSMFFQV